MKAMIHPRPLSPAVPLRLRKVYLDNRRAPRDASGDPRGGAVVEAQIREDELQARARAAGDHEGGGAAVEGLVEQDADAQDQGSARLVVEAEEGGKRKREGKERPISGAWRVPAAQP